MAHGEGMAVSGGDPAELLTAWELLDEIARFSQTPGSQSCDMNFGGEMPGESNDLKTKINWTSCQSNKTGQK